MSIRLIASDMDGTLLDPRAAVSKANQNAVKRLTSYGVEFIICTGRAYQDAKAILDSCGISCAYICLSGAATYRSTGSLMSEIPLTKENVSAILNLLAPYHMTLDIMTSTGLYTTNLIHLPKELPPDAKIYKICCENLSEELVSHLKRQFAAYPDIAAASSFKTNIELTNQNAQKGYALAAYAASSGISLDDIMVIGDSDNDLSMFTPQFGYTVAMENSMDCIRKAAKYHTKSNADDGVAWAIQTYVFHEIL